MSSLSSCDDFPVKMSIPYDTRQQIQLNIEGASCSACGFLFSGGASPSKYQICQHYFNSHQVKLIAVEAKEEIPRQCKLYSTIKDADDFIRLIVMYHLDLNLKFSDWDLKITKELFAPYIHSYDVTLSSIKMQWYLHQRYAKIVTTIAKQLKNVIFSLRIDVVSHGGAGYLFVITAHFYQNWTLRILALGSIVISEKEMSNSSETVRYLIMDCLEKYNLQEKQIYAYSFGYSDDLLQLSKSTMDGIKEEDSDTGPMMYSICQDLFDKRKVLDSPERTITKAVQRVLTVLLELEACRSFIEHTLMTSPSSDIRIPPLDDKNKWVTTLKMLRRLLAIKKRLSDEQCKEIDWDFVREIIDVLEAIEKLFQGFPRESYIITDFARDLWLCEIRLKEMAKEKNEHATQMLKSLADCTQDLQTSPLYLAALFVDPRFNIVNAPKLSSSEKQTAIDFINKLYGKMLAVENDSIKEESLTRTERTSTPKRRRMTPEDLLRSAMYVQGYHKEESDIKKEESHISHELRTLCREFARDSDTNVPFYWCIESVKKPLLGKVASILLSVPISQFTTEKILDCLPMVDQFISSNESLEDLERRILVKLNKNLD